MDLYVQYQYFFVLHFTYLGVHTHPTHPLCLLVRPHHFAQPVITVAARGVFVSIGHDREPNENGRADRDTIWGVDSRVLGIM